MKVVAFGGSGRKDGNTALLVREVFQKLEQEGFENGVPLEAEPRDQLEPQGNRILKIFKE